MKDSRWDCEQVQKLKERFEAEQQQMERTASELDAAYIRWAEALTDDLFEFIDQRVEAEFVWSTPSRFGGTATQTLVLDGFLSEIVYDKRKYPVGIYANIAKVRKDGSPSVNMYIHDFSTQWKNLKEIRLVTYDDDGEKTIEKTWIRPE